LSLVPTPSPPNSLVNQYANESQEHPEVTGRSGIAAMAWLYRRDAETGQIVIRGRSWKLCGIFCDSFE